MNITSDRLSRWMPAMFAYASVKLGLGLVYGIAIEDGVVDVTMTMTTPGCPAQDYIVAGVERRLADDPGVTGVFVAVVWNPAWSPRLMSLAAKAHFRIREDAE